MRGPGEGAVWQAGQSREARIGSAGFGVEGHGRARYGRQGRERLYAVRFGRIRYGMAGKAR